MRVFLTGFMGTGKSSVGRALALRLGVPFVDLDTEVERAAGRSIRDLFATSGEAEFRRLEQRTLETLLAESDAGDDDGSLVLATGGGTVTRESNRRLLRSRGTVVWLCLPFPVIAARVHGPGRTERPLFRSEEEARRLYESRLPVYRQCDLRIDVGREEPPEEVAARIASRLAEVAS